jgi:nucleoid DNA-binding protein
LEKKYNFAYMVELIQELLVAHNCVIIPGFGAFIGNYKPADVRLYEHKIYPPSKNIAFNRTLQVNDGLLVSAVVQQFSVSYQEAEQMVTAFSKECMESLSQNKALILKDIGKFTFDEQQQLQFQPFFTRNYNAASLGLDRLEITPIQRLKDIESELQENYQRVLHPEKMEDAVAPRRKSKLSYSIAAVLASALVISSLAWNIHTSHPNQSSSALIPVPEPVKTDVAVSDKAEVVPAETELNIAEESVAELPVAEPSAVAAKLPVLTAVSGKSYIVVGAFFDAKHAEKVKMLAESKGYQAVITLDYNDLIYRVSVETENEGVDTVLYDVKTTINQRAWVYCKNCSM